MFNKTLNFEYFCLSIDLSTYICNYPTKQLCILVPSSFMAIYVYTFSEVVKCKFGQICTFMAPPWDNVVLLFYYINLIQTE